MPNTPNPSPSDVEQALEEAGALASTSPDEALAILRQTLRRYPEHPDATQLLGEVLKAKGHADWELKAVALSRALHSPELLHAARLLNENKLPEAEAVLRPYLRDYPSEPSARLLLADLALRSGHDADVEAMLREALELAPCYASARFKLAHLLFGENRLAEALDQFERLLQQQPDDSRVLDLKARTFNRLGRVEEAATLYERMLATDPDNGKTWAHYGHSLRFLGRREDSIRAYRKALELDDTLAPVWWSLANLKTVKLEGDDIDTMLSALTRDHVRGNDRVHLHFALAKAIEDQGSAREAFGHYVEGNALRRAESKHDAAWVSTMVREAATLCDPAFFAERESWGAPDSGPIFIVGMPRAGSTLVEQILASHPQIEGLAELPYVATLARQLGDRSSLGYPRCLTALDHDECVRLGRRFAELTAPHRMSDRPFYIDKNPNNWLVLDFIQLILPNARIIDVRRHPLACGVSNFRQLFAEGQDYSYSLDHIGRYYRDYVSMLQRIDEVRPGRVHRVIYEQLVDDPRSIIESLLAFLGLEFDEACLNFHDNDRAIRTPSSEQVRQPINRAGLEQWRAFDRWLGPLKTALGSVIDSYPEVPVDLKK